MVFVAFFLAAFQLVWLWRCYLDSKADSRSMRPSGQLLNSHGCDFNGAMAGSFLLLLTSLSLLLIPIGFGLIPRSQAMVFICLHALVQGVMGIWLAGLAWLGELPNRLGERWLWLLCLVLFATLMAASGMIPMP